MDSEPESDAYSDSGDNLPSEHLNTDKLDPSDRALYEKLKQQEREEREEVEREFKQQEDSFSRHQQHHHQQQQQTTTTTTPGQLLRAREQEMHLAQEILQQRSERSERSDRADRPDKELDLSSNSSRPGSNKPDSPPSNGSGNGNGSTSSGLGPPSSVDAIVKSGLGGFLGNNGGNGPSGGNANAGGKGDDNEINGNTNSNNSGNNGNNNNINSINSSSNNNNSNTNSNSNNSNSNNNSGSNNGIGNNPLPNILNTIHNTINNNNNLTPNNKPSLHLNNPNPLSKFPFLESNGFDGMGPASKFMPEDLRTHLGLHGNPNFLSSLPLGHPLAHAHLALGGHFLGRDFKGLEGMNPFHHIMPNHSAFPSPPSPAERYPPPPRSASPHSPTGSLQPSPSPDDPNGEGRSHNWTFEEQFKQVQVHMIFLSPFIN